MPPTIEPMAPEPRTAIRLIMRRSVTRRARRRYSPPGHSRNLARAPTRPSVVRGACCRALGGARGHVGRHVTGDAAPPSPWFGPAAACPAANDYTLLFAWYVALCAWAAVWAGPPSEPAWG